MNIKWDWQHTAIMIGATALGAEANYLQHEPTGAVVAALGSWAIAKPILVGGLGAALVAVVALAKDTFLADVPPAGGAPVIPIRQPPPAAVSAPPPAPPVVTRWAFAVMLAACMLLGGCQGAKDPVTEVNEYVTYVQTFESGAKLLFAALAPSLGSNQAAASAAFTKATLLLDGAIVTAEDAAKAIADGIAQDMPKLFADVSAAVQQVIATYDQFAGAGAPKGIGASAPDTIHHQAAVIASWRP